MAREVTDPYNIEELTVSLNGLGYQFQYTSETSSTMRQAEEHVLEGGSLPAIFLTDHQTQGIGREGRKWLDKSGNSVLVSQVNRIKPDTTPSYMDLVALHVCRTIREVTGVDKAQIKYPNDLVIEDEKFGGILIINILQEGSYVATNTGIGINVHYSKQDLEDYPTDYGATALDLYTPRINRRVGLVLALMGGLKFTPADAQIFSTNNQYRQDYNNIWRGVSSVYGRIVQVETEEGVLVRGKVADTQIGQGVLIEDAWGSKWFNHFDTRMKVRVN